MRHVKRHSLLTVLMVLCLTITGSLVIRSPVMAATLNKRSARLVKGQTINLTLSGTDEKPTWQSSNKKVAKVSRNGHVRATGKGKCYIYAWYSGKVRKCKIVVETPKLSTKTALMNKGETFKITVKNTRQSVSFVSDNESIATIDENGIITGLTVGETNVRAYLASGKKYTCRVIVRQPEAQALSVLESGYTAYQSLTGTTRISAAARVSNPNAFAVLSPAIKFTVLGSTGETLASHLAVGTVIRANDETAFATSIELPKGAVPASVKAEAAPVSALQKADKEISEKITALGVSRLDTDYVTTIQGNLSRATDANGAEISALFYVGGVLKGGVSTHLSGNILIYHISSEKNLYDALGAEPEIRFYVQNA